MLTVGSTAKATKGPSLRDHPTVVSYYTPNSRYEDHANRLAKSLSVLGIPYRIEARESLGSWVRNCSQKALFVRDMRNEVSGPIIWIDADAVVRRPLDNLRGCDADFSVVKRDGWSFSGGQIFFADSVNAKTLIDVWCDYATNFPHVWDQVTLDYAWWDCDYAGNLSTVWMDPGVFTKQSRTALGRLKQRIFSNATIVHAQESRTSKRTMPSAVREVSTSDVRRWWREAASHDRTFALSSEQRAELGLFI